jgi:uroporphyrinogen III methyltransferase/synthase
MPEGKLTGKTIIVTRSRNQATELTERLEQEGAKVHEIPAIEIVERPDGIAELQDELQRLSDYSWLLLTSVNSVIILDRVLRNSGLDWRIFEPLKIGCIGTATAAKVKELGGRVHVVPAQFQAESFSRELLKSDLKEKEILLPRAEGSRPVLPDQLTEAGAIVKEIHIYKAELPPQSKEELQKVLTTERVDFLTFTSSSTVRNFIELAGDLHWQSIPVACIGPITAETLREYGVEPTVEAKEFTIPGLVEALINART